MPAARCWPDSQQVPRHGVKASEYRTAATSPAAAVAAVRRCERVAHVQVAAAECAVGRPQAPPPCRQRLLVCGQPPQSRQTLHQTKQLVDASGAPAASLVSRRSPPALRRSKRWPTSACRPARRRLAPEGVSSRARVRKALPPPTAEQAAP
eukprot:scaffold2176_cov350-Prasinococcus_capsulatus_cf.AAC.9